METSHNLENFLDTPDNKSAAMKETWHSFKVEDPDCPKLVEVEIDELQLDDQESKADEIDFHKVFKDYLTAYDCDTVDLSTTQAITNIKSVKQFKIQCDEVI